MKPKQNLTHEQKVRRRLICNDVKEVLTSFGHPILLSAKISEQVVGINATFNMLDILKSKFGILLDTKLETILDLINDIEHSQMIGDCMLDAFISLRVDAYDHYMVGEVVDEDSNNWIFQGVYSSEDVAVSKCIGDNFFVAGIEIDYDEPSELRSHKYAYYPTLQPKPNGQAKSNKNNQV